MFKINFYNYNSNPRNPKLKPKIFQKRYLSGSYDLELPDDIESGIVEFLLKTSVIYGDRIDYDWNTIENQEDPKEEDLILNLYYLELVDKIIKEYLKTNTNKLEFKRIIEEKSSFDNMEFSYLFRSIFSFIEIEYNNYKIQTKYQIFLKTATNESIISLMGYKIKQKD